MENEQTSTWLKIARMLAEKHPVHEICSELRVSGKHVGDVKALIEQNYITIDAQNRPAFTGNYEEAEMFLDEYRSKRFGRKPKFKHLETAEQSVAGAVQQAIATEARADTEQFLTLGRVTWQAFAAYAAKKGWDVSKIREIPIHRAILNALEKEAEFDKLVKHAQELEETLTFYQSRLDPLIRLERGIEMLRSFLEFAVLADAIGVDALESEIGTYYTHHIQRFLTGQIGETT